VVPLVLVLLPLVLLVLPLLVLLALLFVLPLVALLLVLPLLPRRLLPILPLLPRGGVLQSRSHPQSRGGLLVVLAYYLHQAHALLISGDSHPPRMKRNMAHFPEKQV
jgi:hypothetical protein